MLVNNDKKIMRLEIEKRLHRVKIALEHKEIMCPPSQKIAAKQKIARDAMIFIKNVAFT